MKTDDLRFKAWDHDDKKMVKVGAIDWAEGQIISPNYPKGKLYPNERFGDHVTMLQYSGLKDQHGNELYEGDIAVDDDDLYVIKFEDGCFYVVLDHDTGAVITQLSELNEDIRLLGNIYENPELLETT